MADGERQAPEAQHVNQNKKQTRIAANLQLSVTSGPELSLFPFFLFLILVHPYNVQVHTLRLAQGPKELSVGKPEHISTVYRLLYILTVMPENVTQKL